MLDSTTLEVEARLGHLLKLGIMCYLAWRLVPECRAICHHALGQSVTLEGSNLFCGEVSKIKSLELFLNWSSSFYVWGWIKITSNAP
jgi:hypothetical protein